MPLALRLRIGLEKVTLVPLVLSRVTLPLDHVIVPVPRALLLLIAIEPEENVTPPVKEFDAESTTRVVPVT